MPCPAKITSNWYHSTKKMYVTVLLLLVSKKVTAENKTIVKKDVIKPYFSPHGLGLLAK